MASAPLVGQLLSFLLLNPHGEDFRVLALAFTFFKVLAEGFIFPPLG